MQFGAGQYPPLLLQACASHTKFPMQDLSYSHLLYLRGSARLPPSKISYARFVLPS